MEGLNVNGVCLELDILDADVFERYEDANNRVIDETQDEKTFEGLTYADKMRKQCRIIDKFFDSVFGDGTAFELFGGNNNLGDRLEAYAGVNDYISRNDRIKSITDTYSPRRLENRQQRRAQANKHDGFNLGSAPSRNSNPPAGLTQEQFELALKIARESGINV